MFIELATTSIEKEFERKCSYFKVV